MAISVLSVWEIRPATGSTNNGGFYKPGATGTDFSQQTSPQYALTGVTTSGTSAVLLTASAAADMVGNGLKLVSGTNGTVGWYEILSVSVGVSITVDRNVSSGSLASGVVNIGGAIASPFDFYNNLSSGNIAWMTGTFTATTNLGPTSSSVGGTNSTTPTTLKGYGSSRGDNTKATWTTATNSTVLISLGFNSPFSFQFQDIKFSTTAATPAAGINQNGATACGILFLRCEFTSFTSAVDGSGNNGFFDLFFERCEIHACTSHGVQNNGSTSFFNSYVHDNTGDGFKVTGASVRSLTVIKNCVFYKNANGVNCTNTQNLAAGNSHISFVLISSAFSDNTAAGIAFSSATNGVMFAYNNIFYNNTTYGINVVAPITVLYSSLNNAFGANGTAAQQNWPPGVDVTLTADPFTARASNDFSLNSTAGGGAACKAAGFPGATGLFGTGNADIGPLQSSGGGGTTNVFVPAVNIFIFETEEG